MSSSSKRKPSSNLDLDAKTPQNPNFSPSKTPESYDTVADDATSRRRKRAESAASDAADTVVVLRGMIDFRASTGATPTKTTMDAFHNSIRSSVSTTITKKQLYNKIRHLRHKFNHSSPSDGGGTIYDLSVEAWSPSLEQNKSMKKVKISHEMKKETGAGKNETVDKVSMKNEVKEVKEEEEEEEDLGIGSGSFPLLIHEVTKNWKANGLSIACLEAARVTLPPHLFDCRSLCTLKIEGCNFPSLMPAICLPSLKSLVLYHVHLNDAAIQLLVASCPSLEALTLSCVRGMTRFCMFSPSATDVAIYNCHELRLFDICYAPKLRVLSFSGGFARLGPLQAIASNLEEVMLFFNERHPFETQHQWKEFISIIAHAKVIRVNSWFRQFSVDETFVFENLKELHWRTEFKKLKAASIRALILVLKGCPRLQQLCINLNYYRRKPRGLIHSETNLLKELESVDDYCPYHLEMVKVIEYAGELLEGLLVKFLLRRTLNLKSMSLFYVPEVAGELSRIQQEVTSWHRASGVARVSLREITYDACPKVDTSCGLSASMLDKPDCMV